IPNGVHGVLIEDKASNNEVGGDGDGEGNVISANTSSGVRVVDAGSTGNEIRGNVIGLDAAGTNVLGNLMNGVSISGGATDNLVGGPEEGASNTIRGNGVGVLVFGGTTTGNSIQQN